jgi:hypothetical protein
MDLTVNRNVWKNYSEEDKERFADAVFEYYRASGFPYFPSDHEFRKNELEKFTDFPYMKLLDGKNIGQSMHGLSFCWSYMPHAYSVRCNDMRTPFETYNDDELFKQVIRRRMKMGDTVTPNGIRKMLKIFTGTQCVSNFRPTAAAVFYNMFGKGKTVWDMSCGYGGRMLGAMRACVGTYIGTEPCTETFDGLCAMLDEFPQFNKKTKYELHKLGSECFKPESGSLDLCFTSPPYFNTEKYSDDETQSYVKYKTPSEWMGGFMKDTLENCYNGLKPNGILAVNIANVRSYPNIEKDMVEVAESIGFCLNTTMHYALSMLALDRTNKFKYEPIYIFTKDKRGDLTETFGKPKTLF